MIKGFLAAALCATVLCATGATAQTVSGSGNTSSMQLGNIMTKLDSLTMLVNTINNKVTDLDGRVSTLEKNYTTLDSKVTDLTKQVNALTTANNNAMSCAKQSATYNGSMCVRVEYQACLQFWDNGGANEAGIVRCSGWSPSADSWSVFATDSNGFDPDGAKILLQHRVVTFKP